jgi:anti-anti-sigma factor
MDSVTEINVTRNGPEVIVKGTGALDLSNAKELRLALDGATMSAESVVVDLRSAVFIDTAILECLARAGKAMIERGKRLKILTSELSHPLRVLRTVGFSALVDIVAEPAEEASGSK